MTLKTWQYGGFTSGTAYTVASSDDFGEPAIAEISVGTGSATVVAVAGAPYGANSLRMVEQSAATVCFFGVDDTAATSFSIAVVFKMSAHVVAENQWPIAVRTASGAAHLTRLQFTTGDQVKIMNTAATSVAQTTNSALTLGSWYLLTWTFSALNGSAGATSVKLYELISGSWSAVTGGTASASSVTTSGTAGRVRYGKVTTVGMASFDFNRIDQNIGSSTEIVPALSTAVSGSDSSTFTEGTTGLLASSTVTDSGTLSETSSVSQIVSVSASDSSTFTEAATETSSDESNDSSTLTETSSVSREYPVDDTQTLTETSLVQADVPSVDDAEQTEAEPLIGIATTDSATQSEGVTALLRSTSTTDTQTLSETSSIVQLVDKSASDTLTLQDGGTGVPSVTHLGSGFQAPASSHTISLTGATAGMGVLVEVAIAATIVLDSASATAGWVVDIYDVNQLGVALIRLPAASNTGGTLPDLTVTHNGPRQLAYAAVQTQLASSASGPQHANYSAASTTLTTDPLTQALADLIVVGWGVTSTVAAELAWTLGAWSPSGWATGSDSGAPTQPTDEAVRALIGYKLNTSLTAETVTVSKGTLDGQTVGWTEAAYALAPTGGSIAQVEQITTSSGSASFSFSASGTAGATGAGSASFAVTASGIARAVSVGTASFAFAASGGAQSPTAGSASFTVTASGVGRAPVAGSASFAFSATGTGTAQGGATGSASFAVTAAGGVGARAAGSASFDVVLSGVGLPPGTTAAASFAFSAAGGARAATTSTASFAVTASGSASVAATSSASFSFSASGGTQAPVTSTASFTVTAGGTATGGNGGSATFDVVATGAARASITSTASFSFSASGIGVGPGQGAGTASFAVSASGGAGARGAGSASFVVSATATTTSPVSGSASFTVTATGTPTVGNTATASFSLTAGGAARAVLFANALFSVIAGAAAQARASGAASFTITASAFAIVPGDIPGHIEFVDSTFVHITITPNQTTYLSGNEAFSFST